MPKPAAGRLPANHKNSQDQLQNFAFGIKI